MKIRKIAILVILLAISQFSFSATAINKAAIQQENLIKYVDNQVANNEIRINEAINTRIAALEKNVFAKQESILNDYKLISIIIYSIVLAILLIIFMLIINTYSLARKTQKLYQTPQIYKPNYTVTRQNPFYFITDGDAFKLIGLMDSWLDEDDYLKRVSVLMYFLPDKIAQIIWENIDQKNELINTLLKLDGVDQNYVAELAENIKGNLSNFVDKSDALGTVFDKLPEYHRTKLIKTMNEQNVLPKGFVLRFNDILKQPKASLKQRLTEVPISVLGLAMQTISKAQIKTIFSAISSKKGIELKAHLKLLENQRICQENIDKSKEFIVKHFNYNV